MGKIDLEKFKDFLEENLEEDINFNMTLDDLFYFSSDIFKLAFEFEEDTFVIRDFTSLIEGEGNGKRIITLVVKFLADSDFSTVKASDIKPNIEPFWEECGFEFDGIHGYLEL